MSRVAYLLYGLVAYLLFFAAILYGIGFVGNFVVPKGIDDGQIAPLSTAILVNVLLLFLFAVQHNVMARRWFKDWWTEYVPRPIERSTYVAASSLILLLVYWQWRPMPDVVWHVENSIGRGVLWVLYFAGWAIVFASSFVIDHFELFGLRQVWNHFIGREPAPPHFTERLFYRWVRHPLMLGFIIAFWATPMMTVGHPLFAVATTAYIFVGFMLEERDLVAMFGDEYRHCRERVSMLVPWRKLV